ncbi:MAG TPA: calcium-translocating P-type ATPase, SERCA-type [Candidatus Nanoarchaeia archaeon]|nr:calcium-translocating P-type ATPase, SERCA-type [Candidatus Nanoarchaeia archaeon]
MEYQSKSAKELFAELRTTERGITSQEAVLRLSTYGKNEIKDTEVLSKLKIFLSQFSSPVVLILVAALIISVVVKEYVDASVIGIILIINAILGFIQEYRAEKAIAALKKAITPQAKVIRDGKEQIIDATLLVPGDILILEEGTKIPADAILLEASELKTIEASLTGESAPVKKSVGICTETILGNIFNGVFYGTAISSGRGKAIVVNTGMKTELGKIAHLIQDTETPPTPLQKHLKKLGATIGVIVILIAIGVYILGVLGGRNNAEVLLSALSLAVAAVPEGMPAVITIALAIGVQRMLKRKALVRKLPSVETLGACTVICSDKTGTLTKGEMTVTELYTDKKSITITGTGYVPEGTFSAKTNSMELLLTCGVVCNNATLQKNNTWEILGDPTEGALLVSAQKYGLTKENLTVLYTRIREYPFKSERKMMSVIVKNKKDRLLFSKGAPEVIINSSKYILINGKKKPFTDAEKKELLGVNKKLGQEALRVLGFAYKEITKDDSENDLIFIGLQGMMDPAREEVKEAIQRCTTAGIRTVMITGDYEVTAKAIADRLGITGKVVSGENIEKINLEEEIDSIGVFARVNPEHKLRIVEALQKKGHVVAMTGDGVNDAPALKKADIGVAMGITGTDVAKESSQMVLLDDNFTTIVNAVEEGRNIFSNIREFIEYLFSSNIGEVLVIVVALLMQMPLPLVAIQILWINLLTDGLPALALGVDPPEKDIMLRKPRKRNGIINGTRWIYIFGIGILMMFGTLALYQKYLPQGESYAQTIAFTTLVLFQLFNAFNLRSTTRSFFAQNPFGNIWLIGAVLASLLLQLAVLYTPLSTYFNTVALTTMDWLYVVVTAFSVIMFGELVKFGKYVFKKTQ